MNEPDIGPLPELAWLPVDRCYVDPGYQRSLETPRGEKLIAKIAAEFAWPKFGALMAAPGEPDAVGPRWLIIDGQHRHAGAKLFNKLGRGDIAHVPAVVHKDLDRAAQAAAFVGANRDRVQVYAQQIYRAQLLAGEGEAITLQRLADAAGIRLLHYPLAAKQTPAGSTAAVPALRAILRTHGEAVAGAAIGAVAERCMRQPGGLRGPYFLAAALYLKAGGTAETLRAALARFDVRQLEGLAERLSPNSAAKAIAEALARRRDHAPVEPSRAAASPAATDPAKGGQAPAPAPRATEKMPAPMVPRPQAVVTPAPEGAAPPIAGRPEGRFRDDPAAVRDHGSPGRMPRAEPFGFSSAGSSLAGAGN